MNRSHALALIASLLVHSARAQSPALNNIVPSAAAPGQSTEVTIFGDNISSPTKLWTSFPAAVEFLTRDGKRSDDDSKATVRLTIPKGTPTGIGAVRLVTSSGVSELRLLMLDDLPIVRSSGTNNSVANAQLLKPPVAVEGACEELAADFYKFTAARGQQLSLEVIAQRLGSPLDPLVRILDAKGRELAWCDDEPGLGADCRLRHKFAASGEYVIELRDTGYQGGPRHRYRLRLGDFPFSSPAFPLGVQQSTKSKNPSAELTEAEPNDTPPTATKFIVPAALNGRFAQPKDRDWYQFDVKKGQRLIFRGRTRSLGSPSELFLRLTKPDGAKIAQANLSGADEGVITNTFNEAGKFCLLVEELAQRSGPEHAYRVEIEPYRAGFALSTDTEHVNAAPGGSFDLKVNCARRDYSGPIQFALDGAGEGFAIESKSTGNKTNENYTLKVSVSSRMPPGSLTQFKIVGRATIDGQPFTATASTMPALKKLFSPMPYPPAELDGLIALGLKPMTAKPDRDESSAK